MAQPRCLKINGFGCDMHNRCYLDIIHRRSPCQEVIQPNAAYTPFHSGGRFSAHPLLASRVMGYPSPSVRCASSPLALRRTFGPNRIFKQHAVTPKGSSAFSPDRRVASSHEHFTNLWPENRCTESKTHARMFRVSSPETLVARAYSRMQTCFLLVRYPK